MPDLQQNHAIDDRPPTLLQTLAAYYPVVYRMAMGLSGREDVGQAAVRFVMDRSLRLMSQWAEADAAERWFHHHTVLTVRRAAKWAPDPKKDALLLGSRRAEQPEYVAFLRALRALPVQQREAFILHHGERLDVRHLGIAMDCSREAAANHLQAATDVLKLIGGPEFSAFTAEMAGAYQRLAPSEELSLPRVKGLMRGYLWRRRLRRLGMAIILLGLAALLGWIYLRWGAAIQDIITRRLAN